MGDSTKKIPILARACAGGGRTSQVVSLLFCVNRLTKISLYDVHVIFPAPVAALQITAFTPCRRPSDHRRPSPPDPSGARQPFPQPMSSTCLHCHARKKRCVRSRGAAQSCDLCFQQSRLCKLRIPRAPTSPSPASIDSRPQQVSSTPEPLVSLATSTLVAGERSNGEAPNYLSVPYCGLTGLYRALDVQGWLMATIQGPAFVESRFFPRIPPGMDIQFTRADSPTGPCHIANGVGPGHTSVIIRENSCIFLTPKLPLVVSS